MMTRFQKAQVLFVVVAVIKAFFVSLRTVSDSSFSQVLVDDRTDDVTQHSSSSTAAANSTFLSSIQEKLHAIRQENDAVSLSGKKVFSHFFMHIPKTGSSYAMHKINRILWGAQEKSIARKLSSTNGPNSTTVTAKKMAIRACDQARKPIQRFSNGYTPSFKGVRCAMWMSESQWPRDVGDKNNTSSMQLPHHNYVILRNPEAHVLSQYFHCTESRESQKGKRFERLPSLDEWLELWVNATTQGAPPPHHIPCYNPTNLQSRYVNFEPGETTKEELKQRFVVLGDQSRMDQSVCIISLMYSGLLSEQCHCAADESSHNNTNASGKVILYDHGVTNHGDTFSVTPSQKEAIRILTEKDRILYDMGKEILDEQIDEIEQGLGIRICEKHKEVR